MNKNQSYKVTNRSMGLVIYAIPEDGIRREFQAGETKQIKFGELEKLTYIPGGKQLIDEYLLITNDDVINELNIHTEPEYFMTEDQIRDLIVSGSHDAWLDCLEFAPAGVIDLVKKLSVTIPLNDITKRRSLKEKTGFDVDAAISNSAEDAPDSTAGSGATSTGTSRRTTTNYRIVEKK